MAFLGVHPRTNRLSRTESVHSWIEQDCRTYLIPSLGVSKLEPLQGDFFNWSPPKFSKYKIPCKLDRNVSKCQRL